MKQPTQAQKDYATELLRKLGYNRDSYKLEEMTRRQVSELISRLKYELALLK